MDRLKRIPYSKYLHVCLAADLATFELDQYVQKKSISPAKKKFVRRLSQRTTLDALLHTCTSNNYENNYRAACQRYITFSCIALSFQYALDILRQKISGPSDGFI